VFKLIKNKRGSKVAYVMLIGMIIAVVAFTVLILIARGILPFQASKEKLCETSNEWSSMMGVGGSAGFCSATSLVIDAKDWSKCDTSFKSGFFNAKSEKDRTKWAKHCAAQQILDNIVGCFGMGGKGAWDPSSFMCYTFVVKLDKETEEAMDKVDAFAESVQKRVVESVKAATGETLKKSVTNEIEGLAKERKMYEMLVDWHIDKIWAKIDSCKKNEEIDALNLTLKIVETPNDISNIISGSIDATKDGCNDVESVINDNLDTITARRENVNETDEKLDKLLVDNGIQKEVVTAGDVAELSGAIGTFSFSEDFLKSLAKTTKIKGTDETYADAMLSLENFELVGGIDIDQGGFYEIGYCSPPNKLGSGVGVRLFCNMLMHGQVVQVAVGGTGAGGLLRTGSPLPAYCGSFSSQTGGIWDAPTKWCENIMEGVFGGGT